MSDLLDFPTPVRIKGRLYFASSALETYKRKLLAEAFGCEPEPVASSAPETLIPAPQVAKQFGVSRRTIGRRLANAKTPAHGA